MELAEILVDKGNPNSITDVGVAAEVAYAGLRGACMNVLINLSEIDDSNYVIKKQKEVDVLLLKSEDSHKKIFDKIIFALKEFDKSK